MREIFVKFRLVFYNRVQFLIRFVEHILVDFDCAFDNSLFVQATYVSDKAISSWCDELFKACVFGLD